MYVFLYNSHLNYINCQQKMIEINQIRKYKYVDSSQDQTNDKIQSSLKNKTEPSDDFLDQNDYFRNQNNKHHFYDSSEDEDVQNGVREGNGKSKQNRNTQNKKSHNGKSKKLCKINSDAYLLKDNYMHQLEQIVRKNKQKIEKKAPLLLPDTDKQILQNLDKRNQNYGYFLKALAIDKKYQQILQNKTKKVKAQNQRKKAILDKKKAIFSMKQDQTQLKKFVIQKKFKQQIVLDKVQKHAYKLGIQRVRNQQKKIKTQTKQIDRKAKLKMTNLQIQQKNKINQLRQQLQNARQATKVNKLDQKKAIQEMHRNNLEQKKQILVKTSTSKDFKF